MENSNENMSQNEGISSPDVDLLLALKDPTDHSPFWTRQYRELSRNLWLPTKNGCTVPNLNSSYIYPEENETHSWFSSIKSQPHEKKKWSRTTKFPSSPYLKPGPNVKVKARKILIYPTLDQKKLIREWFGLYRWFYNRAVDVCEKYEVYDLAQVKSRVNGSVDGGTNVCKEEKCEAVCINEYCNKHTPKPNTCGENECNTKCAGEYCSKHIKRNLCQATMKNGLACLKPCIQELCPWHKPKTKGQYESVIPEWYDSVKYPIVPRFITGAIQDCTKAYASAFALLAAGHIKNFDMHYKTKKDKVQSMYVEKTCFTNENIFLPRLFKEPLKFGFLHDSEHKKIPFEILDVDEMDGRIEWNMVLDKYYYVYNSTNLPVKRVESQDTLIQPKRLIALDSGIRTFQTGYSPNGHVVEFGGPLSYQTLVDRKEILSYKVRTRHVCRQIKRIDQAIKHNKYNLSRIQGYCLAQDNLRSKIDKTRSKNKKKMYWKVFYRLSARIKHMVDDLHWKTINYLTTNYDCVALGELNIKNILISLPKYMKTTRRHLLLLKQGLFKTRLAEKCAERNVVYKLQNEACTSRTCSNCGWYHRTLDGNKTYTCGRCEMVMDRDVNAARNIYMRAWLERESEFRFSMRASATYPTG